MKKKKTLLPFLLVKYFAMGVFYTITFLTDFLLESVLAVFKLIEYVFYGWMRICQFIYFIFKWIMKSFVFVCFILYKIVKYFCLGLIYPAILINVSSQKSRINRLENKKKGKEEEAKDIKEA